MWRISILVIVILVSLCDIRGQSGEPESFDGALTGEQVVPPNTSAARGRVKLTLYPGDDFVVIDGTFAGLDGPPTAVHLHIAPAGEPTTVVTLDIPFSSGPSGNLFFTGIGALTGFEKGQIRRGFGCVDIHTSAFPNGELRAKLAAPRRGDLDGDSRADLSNVRYTTFGNEPYTFMNRNSTTGPQYVGPLGISQRDTFCDGDFDADGITDLCLYRDGASAGAQSLFFTINSSDSTVAVKEFGIRGDIPVPGRYDKDIKTDFAIFRRGATQGAQANFWFTKSTVGPNAFFRVPFGTTGFQSLSGDLPVPSDYDGDGVFDLAVYRFGGIAPNNHFIILQSSDGAVRYRQLGDHSTDVVVPRCDFDGDGKDDLTLVRAGQVGTPMIWIHEMSSTGELRYEQYGKSTDIPVPADYNGDGLTDLAIFRRGPPTLYWIKNSASGTVAPVQWGIQSDTPVANWFVK